MTVRVWVGEIPEHPQEREAIVALARGLDRLEELYVLLANFTVGGQAVDLAIFKRDGGFVIELKHCDGRVIGGVNGRWEVIDANAEVHVVNPGRRNPYNQVISSFYRLSNFLNLHRPDLMSEHRAAAIDFRTSKRLVVISPFLHPDSEVMLDWKVDLKGLDELPTYLVTATSSEIDLTEEELLAIPQLLRCEPWHDVNLLVSEEGLLEEAWPTPEEAAAIRAGEVAVAEGEEVAAEGVRPPEAVVRSWPRRLGWLALILVAVALLAMGGVWVGVIPNPWPTPTVPATATASPTPTLIIIPTLPEPFATPLPVVEWVEQSVRRQSNYAAGEVEVVLRSVVYGSGETTLQWALVNLGTRPVRFPLIGRNISIQDNIGNEYPVDDSLSEPQVLLARPGERVEGSCTVNRAVNPDALTLRIYINGEPFEGRPPVWPVNIPGRD